MQVQIRVTAQIPCGFNVGLEKPNAPMTNLRRTGNATLIGGFNV